MPPTLAEFLSYFGEFNSVDINLLTSIFNGSLIETGGYSALPEDIRNYAVYLYVAHFLTLELRSQQNGSSSQVKKYKTKYDEVEFFDSYGTNILLATNYGVRLQRILDSTFIPFCYPSYTEDCGC